MCSVFGALLWNGDYTNRARVNNILKTIYRVSHERGRDGRGYTIDTNDSRETFKDVRPADSATLQAPYFSDDYTNAVVIGNTRAEPTTEYVREKQTTDQQPYGEGIWNIVHNGTIANDHELRMLTQGFLPDDLLVPTRIDSAAIVECLEAEDKMQAEAFEQVWTTVQQLKGSYAILAQRGCDAITVAVNYRPVWYIETDFGVFFASTRDSFPINHAPQMVKPYTVMHFWYDADGVYRKHARSMAPPALERSKALVVCSGGLDSVVSAAYTKYTLDQDVELIHFRYGSRAEGPEVEAIKKVAEYMGVSLHIRNIPAWDSDDSPLLRADSTIAGGEAGAEFAHEWVPARNLVMLAMATAFAEAKGFRYIVLGNNLEEAGAYPDNEPEFIARFNDVLPFAVGDGKKVSVVMPVGNMMKHEIVKLGHDIGAPLHLTWSCYRAGKMHCGKCGPCFMRRTAFEINNLPEVIEYEV